MTLPKIRTGFRAIGIWPYNPSKILEEEDLKTSISTPLILIKTALTKVNPLFYIPKAPKDIIDLLDRFQTPRRLQNRNQRRVRVYIKRGFAQYAAENTFLRAENARLRANLTTSRIKKGRKVNIDPNKRFANVEAFEVARKAQVEAAAATETKARKNIEKYGLNSEETAVRIANIKFEDMIFE